MSIDPPISLPKIRVLHVDDDPDLVDLTSEFLEKEDDRFDVVTETDPHFALDRLEEEDIDCIVSDYEMPELNGVEFLGQVRQKHPDLPFILFTGKGSEAIASEAISAGVTDYLQKDVGTDQYALLGRQIVNAVLQYYTEQRLDRQYEQLDQLQQITDTLRRIDERLVRASTRDEIEESVCEVLADAEPYQFAWIGEYDRDAEEIRPRAFDGKGENYLDSIEVTADESSTGQGPGGTAIRTGEVAVTQNLQSDPEFEPWQDEALECGFAAAAGVPITYKDTVYGLLAVYADRPRAFDEKEVALFEDLRETIGHALYRVELNDTLTDPKQRYQDLVGAAPDAILIADEDGEIVEANAAAGDLFGCLANELVGRHQTELHPPDEQKRYTALFELHMERQQPIRRFDDGSQVFISTSQGETVPVEINASTFELAGQTHVYGSFRDISDRLDEEKRFQAFLEALPDRAFLLDEDGRYRELFSGPADVPTLHDNPQTVLGKTVHDVLATDVAEQKINAIQTAIETETPQSFDYSVTDSSEIRWFRGRVAPFEQPESGEQLVVMISEDVTGVRQQQQQLVQIEQKYRAVFEEARDPILIADDDGEYVDVNPAAEELFGLSEDELLGRSIEEFAAADFEFNKTWEKFQQSQTNRGVFPLVRPDGMERVVEYNATPNILPGRHMSILRDITEQHRIGQELTEVVNRISDAFCAVDDDWRLTFVNEHAEELLGRTQEQLRGKNIWEEFPANSQEVYEEEYKRAIETQEPVTFEEYSDTADAWFEVRAYPSETGLSVYFRDISEEKNREQLLQELHGKSQEVLQANTETKVAEYLVGAATGILEIPCVAVLLFDEVDGALTVTTASDSVEEMISDPLAVAPGDNPIWEVYRTGESTVLDKLRPKVLDGVVNESMREVLTVPIGDFGVLLAKVGDPNGFDEVDVELAELLANNAEAALDRLYREQDVTEVSERLADQQTRVRELRSLTDSLHRIQESITETETRGKLEAAICEQLAATEGIAFAWIGHPETNADDLEPQAWDGEDKGYLDTIATSLDGPDHLPAKRAARSQQPVIVANTADRIHTESWRKEAVSRGFKSAISVPLIYDGILYGVLTVYGQDEDAFDSIVGDLVSNLGPLVGSIISVRSQRQLTDSDQFIELEFEFADPNCKFHQLIEGTGCTARFDATIPPETETSVRVLLTVEEGDPTAVLDRADAMSSILDADYFGKQESRQLVLDVQKPFLPNQLQEHGGLLRELVSNDESTSALIEVPENASLRPVIELVTAQYSEVDLLARRQQTHNRELEETSVTDYLTARQHEVLKAAYYGGYYDSPKQVTGEDLADQLDISSPVVYNHLQVAERKIIERIFDSIDENGKLDV